MAGLKVSDVSRAATLLKKLVDRADTNKDGAVRAGEIASISPGNPRQPHVEAQADLRSAMHGVQRFAQGKGSVAVPSIKKAVDEISKRVKEADRDGDGVLSEAELKRLDTVAAQRFAGFARKHAAKKPDDFTLAPQREPKPPRFDWSGTPKQVCTSLLNAYSDRKNDNYWPDWGSPTGGPSRYVLTETEAKKMVKALEPLYPSRQKAVLAELASRTARSEFGCVSCNAGARAVFEAWARRASVSGLSFGSPRAPTMPGP